MTTEPLPAAQFQTTFAPAVPAVVCDNAGCGQAFANFHLRRIQGVLCLFVGDVQIDARVPLVCPRCGRVNYYGRYQKRKELEEDDPC